MTEFDPQKNSGEQPSGYTDYVPNWQPVAQPTEPAQPAQPAAPQQPAQPAAPAQPQPAQPAAPAQPVQPAQPAQQAAPQYATYQPTPQQPQQQYQAPRPQQPQPQQQPAPAPAPKPKKEKPRKGSLGTTFKTFIAGFLGATLGVLLVLGATGNLSHVTAVVDGGNTGNGVMNITVNGDDATLAEAVAAKDLPSIVCIYAHYKPTMGMFGISQGGSGLGSGVILTEDGYILTNHHVIEDAESLQVSVNGEMVDAKVVGEDPTSDLAVVKIDGKNLTPIEIGSSSDLTVGQWVMALGAPYGMEQSVSTGIVSAVSRSSASLQVANSQAVYANMIQTDAAINPGNSGGALVDAQGKLIGINTMIASNSATNSGVGFAIPVDYAYEVAKQLMEGEAPSHAQMGVSLVTIDSYMAQRYDLKSETGAYISEIVSGSGADKAGLEEGDIITKINGKAVTSATDVILAVRTSKVGATVDVEVVREDGSTKSFTVTLGSDKDTGRVS